ncbi:hypothetical protein ABIA31_006566 [Catenulispora sp. MAP5-51]
MRDGGVVAVLCESRRHGFAEAALGVVVLGDDDCLGPRRPEDGVAVQGLDRVQVDDASLDAQPIELFMGFERLVDGDPGGEDGGIIVGAAAAQDFGPADRELLVPGRR